MSLAKRKTDVVAKIYGGRRYPCLCEKPDCTVNGDNVVRFQDRAGLKIAHLKGDCGKEYRRIGV